MTIVCLERTAPVKIGRMQWRGSDDGITWSPWHALLSLSQQVPWYFYYQGRIEVDGRWRVSKIERDEA